MGTTHICEFCERSFEKIRSQRAHRLRCANNPNRKLKRKTRSDKGTSRSESEKIPCELCGKIYSIYGMPYHKWKVHGPGINHDPNAGYSKGTRTAWNKSLTKETHPSVRKAAETRRSKNYKTWCTGKTKRTDERVAKNAEKVRASIKNKIESDEWHFFPRASKAGTYKGIKFHSGWEIKFAQWLDEHEIEWVRTTDSFPYEWNGSTHNYFPDFYLPLVDVYVEIKGQASHRDECKWKVMRNLIVLEGQDLREAAII